MLAPIQFPLFSYKRRPYPLIHFYKSSKDASGALTPVYSFIPSNEWKHFFFCWSEILFAICCVSECAELGIILIEVVSQRKYVSGLLVTNIIQGNLFVCCVLYASLWRWRHRMCLCVCLRLIVLFWQTTWFVWYKAEKKQTPKTTNKWNKTVEDLASRSDLSFNNKEKQREWYVCKCIKQGFLFKKQVTFVLTHFLARVPPSWSLQLSLK